MFKSITASFFVIAMCLIVSGCGENSNNPTAPTSVVEACNYTFLPSRIVTSSLPKKIIARVITGPTCRWVATATDTWIDIVYQGGSGSGDLIFDLQRNQCYEITKGRGRTGFITIKGSKNVLEIFQDDSDLWICPKEVIATAP